MRAHNFAVAFLLFCSNLSLAAGNPLLAVPPSPLADQQVLHLKRMTITDQPNMIGGEVETLLVPAGWQTEGRVIWRNHPAEPGVVVVHLKNSQSPEEINLYPDIPCVWDYHPGPFFPRPGGNYLGSEVIATMDPPTAIRQLMIPRYRRDLPADARIVSCQEFPELAKVFGPCYPNDPNFPHTLRSAKAHLEYTENGVAMEEDLYCLVKYMPIQAIHTMHWEPDMLWSHKAPKGQLPTDDSLLLTIIESTRLNPDFVVRYQLLAQALLNKQLADIKAAGEWGRQIFQRYEKNLGTMRADYERRSAQQASQVEEMSRILRGVEVYHNPDGSSVELPTGYQHAYYNGSTGEYVMSRSSTFNPNRDLNRGLWSEVKQK